jgi:hypothetical protein
MEPSTQTLPANFKVKVGAQTLAMISVLRAQIFKLGPDVVEEVRPHRLSYGRGSTMRTFLHLIPTREELRAEVLKRRGGLPPFIWEALTVKSEEDVQELVSMMNVAYHSV